MAEGECIMEGRQRTCRHLMSCNDTRCTELSVQSCNGCSLAPVHMCVHNIAIQIQALSATNCDPALVETHGFLNADAVRQHMTQLHIHLGCVDYCPVNCTLAVIQISPSCTYAIKFARSLNNMPADCWAVLLLAAS